VDRERGRWIYSRKVNIARVPMLFQGCCFPVSRFLGRQGLEERFNLIAVLQHRCGKYNRCLSGTSGAQ